MYKDQVATCEELWPAQTSQDAPESNQKEDQASALAKFYLCLISQCEGECSSPYCTVLLEAAGLVGGS